MVSQPGPSMPTAPSASLIRPRLGVHQDGEGESDADRADQDREEDDRAQVAAGDDLRGQQQGQRHADDDLEPGGDHRIDQRVAQADDQRLLLEEGPVVVQTDPGRGEQVPPGEGEVEGGEGGDDEEDEVDDPGDQMEPVRVRSRPLLCARLFGPAWRAPGAVASDVLIVLAMAKPFVRVLPPVLARDRRQEESTND